MGTEGITFLGNLDRQLVLPRLYASADAFVFSSVTETLGLVILEAMSSGIPVVAAPAGGVADHLRHGVNGLAYPAGDVDAMAHAMLALVLDRQRAAALGAGARATAESLDWSHELDRLDRSYREVIAAHAVQSRSCDTCLDAHAVSARRVFDATSAMWRPSVARRSQRAASVCLARRVRGERLTCDAVGVHARLTRLTRAPTRLTPSCAGA